ncbi:hypothetical protein MBCUT_20840 [Methanobrevibacter cuticularis]|uniref:DUF2283 domain-containing protein n=1 Tax=Methanobrevibacter cuticularis TaxID=47311 RepID=A0A166CHG5_9EURY|nr:DUF2283 domain-containing protein [Methanobrevibacter cuticularis]KZX14512.1 hypothetical protein MBCUT_20840 [Methanobrevibacter cuticularis]
MKENIMSIDYDYKEDILFFQSPTKQKYEFSEFLDKSVVMDFNKNKIPMGLEILNASKVLKAKKYLLKKINTGDMYIKITEKKIELNIILTIKIHQRPTSIPINVIGDNNYHLPNSQTELAVASS